MPSLPVVWGKCKWLAAIYNISSLFLCNYSIESTCGMLVALCFWRVKGRTCIKFSGVDKLNVFLRVDTRTRLHYLDNDCILKHFGLIDTYPLSLTILAGSICLLLIIYNPSSVNSNFYINYIYHKFALFNILSGIVFYTNWPYDSTILIWCVLCSVSSSSIPRSSKHSINISINYCESGRFFGSHDKQAAINYTNSSLTSLSSNFFFIFLKSDNSSKFYFETYSVSNYTGYTP